MRNFGRKFSLLSFPAAAVLLLLFSLPRFGATQEPPKPVHAPGEEPGRKVDPAQERAPRAPYCSPDFQFDLRYFHDPQLEPLLAAIEKAQHRQAVTFYQQLNGTDTQRRLGRVGLEHLLIRAAPKPDDKVFGSWALYLTLSGDAGLTVFDENDRGLLKKHLHEETAKRSAAPTAPEWLKTLPLNPPARADRPDPAPGIDWHALFNDETKTEAVYGKLFAGHAALPPANGSLSAWREKAAALLAPGNPDLGKLSYLELTVLKEHLLNRFDAFSAEQIEHERAVADDDKSTDPNRNYLAFIAKFPRLSGKARLDRRENERLEACLRGNACDPKTAGCLPVLRELSDFTSRYSGQLDDNAKLTATPAKWRRHGLGIEQRTALAKHFDESSRARPLDEQGRPAADLSNPVAAHLTLKAAQAMMQPVAGGRARQLFGPTDANERTFVDGLGSLTPAEVLGILYNAPAFGPANRWMSFQELKRVVPQNDPAAIKKQNENLDNIDHAQALNDSFDAARRDVEVKTLADIFKVAGRELTPAELEYLRKLPQVDFLPLSGLLHSLAGVPKDATGVAFLKQLVNQSFGRLFGTRLPPGRADLIKGIDLSNPGGGIRFEPRRLDKLVLFPPSEDPMQDELGQRLNQRILDHFAGQVRDAATAREAFPTRDKLFSAYESIYAQRHGRSLRAEICPEPCDLKQPPSDKELLHLARFMRIETLAAAPQNRELVERFDEIARKSVAGLEGRRLELTQRALRLRFEHDLIQSELKRMHTAIAECKANGGGNRCVGDEAVEAKRVLWQQLYKDLERQRADLGHEVDGMAGKPGEAEYLLVVRGLSQQVDEIQAMLAKEAHGHLVATPRVESGVAFDRKAYLEGNPPMNAAEKRISSEEAGTHYALPGYVDLEIPCDSDPKNTLKLNNVPEEVLRSSELFYAYMKRRAAIETLRDGGLNETEIDEVLTGKSEIVSDGKDKPLRRKLYWDYKRLKERFLANGKFKVGNGYFGLDTLYYDVAFKDNAGLDFVAQFSPKSKSCGSFDSFKHYLGWLQLIRGDSQHAADYRSYFDPADEALRRLFHLDGGRRVRVAYQTAPAELKAHAASLEAMDDAAAQAEIQKLATGDPDQRKRYRDLMSYFDRYPDGHPLRAIVMGPNIPDHLREVFKKRPDLRNLWESASPAFQQREHTLLSLGLHKVNEKPEDLEKRLKVAVSDQRRQLAVASPTDDEPASNTTERELRRVEHFTHLKVTTGTIDKWLRKGMEAPNETEFQKFATNPKVFFEAVDNLEPYFETSHSAFLYESKAFFLYHLLQVKRLLKNEHPPGELHPSIAELINGADKKPDNIKLLRMEKLLTAAVQQFNARLNGAPSPLMDPALRAMRPDQLLETELQALREALRPPATAAHMYSGWEFEARSRAYLQSLLRFNNLEQIGPRVKWKYRDFNVHPPENYHGKPMFSTSDDEFTGLAECNYFLFTLNGQHGGYEFKGLPPASRVQILNLAPVARDVLNELCVYRWSLKDFGYKPDGSSLYPEIDKAIAETILGAWPGRVFSTLMKHEVLRKYYADRVQARLKEQLHQFRFVVDVLNKRRANPIDIQRDPEYRMLQILYGERSVPPWNTKWGEGGLPGLITRLPQMSREEKDQFLQWAYTELIKFYPNVDELRKLPPAELQKRILEDLRQTVGQSGGILDNVDVFGKTSTGNAARPLLVLLVSLINESGNDQRGAEGASLDRTLGGNLRFSPLYVALQASEYRKEFPALVPQAASPADVAKRHTELRVSIDGVKEKLKTTQARLAGLDPKSPEGRQAKLDVTDLTRATQIMPDLELLLSPEAKKLSPKQRAELRRQFEVELVLLKPSAASGPGVIKFEPSEEARKAMEEPYRKALAILAHLEEEEASTPVAPPVAAPVASGPVPQHHVELRASIEAVKTKWKAAVEVRAKSDPNTPEGRQAKVNEQDLKRAVDGLSDLEQLLTGAATKLTADQRKTLRKDFEVELAMLKPLPPQPPGTIVRAPSADVRETLQDLYKKGLATLDHLDKALAPPPPVAPPAPVAIAQPQPHHTELRASLDTLRAKWKEAQDIKAKLDPKTPQGRQAKINEQDLKRAVDGLADLEQLLTTDASKLTPQQRAALRKDFNTELILLKPSAASGPDVIKFEPTDDVRKVIEEIYKKGLVALDHLDKAPPPPPVVPVAPPVAPVVVPPPPPVVAVAPAPHTPPPKPGDPDFMGPVQPPPPPDVRPAQLAKFLELLEKEKVSLGDGQRRAILTRDPEVNQILLDLYEPMHGALGNQNIAGLPALWRQLAQTGSGDDIREARMVLMPHSDEFDNRNSVSPAKLRQKIRDDLRRTGKLSPEGLAAAQTLAQAEVVQKWLPDRLKDVFAALTPEDAKTLIRAIAAQQQSVTDRYARDLVEGLRHEVALDEASKYLRTLREANVASGVPVPDSVLQERVRNLLRLAQRDPREKGLTPADAAILKEPPEFLKTVRTIYNLDPVPQYLASLRAVTDESQNAELSAPPERRNDAALRAYSVVRSQFLPELGKKTEELVKGGMAPSDAIDQAYRELMQKAEFQGHAQTLEALRADMHRESRSRWLGASAPGTVLLRGLAVDAKQERPNWCAEKTEKAWGDWQAGEKKRAEKLEKSETAKQWEAFRAESRKRRDAVLAQQAESTDEINRSLQEIQITSRKVTDLRCAQDPFAAGCPRAGQQKKPDEKTDWDRMPEETRRQYRATLKAVERDLEVRRGKLENAYRKLREVNATMTALGNELQDKQQKLMQQLSGQIVRPEGFETSKQKFLRSFVDANDGTLFDSVGHGRAAWLERYFDWRDRADSLGRTLAEGVGPGAAPANWENDPRVKALLDEVKDAADGCPVPKDKALAIVRAGIDSQQAELGTRKQLLETLGRYGITFNGLALDFDDFKIDPNDGKSPEQRFAELRDALTRLGPVLPQGTKDASLIAINSLLQGSPWQQFEERLLMKWNIEARRPMMEWFNPGKATTPVSGAAVEVIRKADGTFEFKFRPLQQVRDEATAVAKELRKAIRDHEQNLRTLRQKKNGFISWIISSVYDTTEQYHQNLDQNLAQIRPLSDKLRAFGGISVQMEEEVQSGKEKVMKKTAPLPSTTIADHSELEYVHEMKVSMDETLRNIAHDQNWRIATVAATAAVATLMIASGVGVLALPALGSAMLHGAAMGFGLALLGATWSQDFVPLITGTPSDQTWSEIGPGAFKSAAVFSAGEGVAALGGAGAEWMWGARLMRTEAPTGVLARGWNGFGKIATNQTAQKMVGMGVTHFTVHQTWDAVEANMEGRDFHFWEKAGENALGGLQTAAYMWGPDQRAAGLFRTFGSRVLTSIAVNQTLSAGLNTWQMFRQFEKMEAEARLADTDGTQAGKEKAKRIRAQIAEQKQLSKFLKQLGKQAFAELPTHAYFGFQAGKAAGMQGMGRDFMSAKDPLKAENFRKLRERMALEEMNGQPGLLSSSVSWAWGKLTGRKRQPLEPSEEAKKAADAKLGATAASSVPQYQINQLVAAAKADPKGPAAEAVALLAAHYQMSPTRFIEVWNIWSKNHTLQGSRPLGNFQSGQRARMGTEEGMKPQERDTHHQSEGFLVNAENIIERDLYRAKFAKDDAARELHVGELLAIRPDRLKRPEVLENLPYDRLMAAAQQGVIGTHQEPILRALAMHFKFRTPEQMAHFFGGVKLKPGEKMGFDTMESLVSQADYARPKDQSKLLRERTLSPEAMRGMYGDAAYVSAIGQYLEDFHPTVDKQRFLIELTLSQKPFFEFVKTIEPAAP